MRKLLTGIAAVGAAVFAARTVTGKENRMQTKQTHPVTDKQSSPAGGQADAVTNPTNEGEVVQSKDGANVKVHQANGDKAKVTVKSHPKGVSDGPIDSKWSAKGETYTIDDHDGKTQSQKEAMNNSVAGKAVKNQYEGTKQWISNWRKKGGATW